MNQQLQQECMQHYISKDHRLVILKNQEACERISPFMGDLARQVSRWALTESQINAAITTLNHQDRWDALTAQVKEGVPVGTRRRIVGVVQWTWSDGNPGRERDGMVLLTREGWAVECTVPSGVPVPAAGDVVSVTLSMGASRRGAGCAIGRYPKQMRNYSTEV